MRTIKFRLVPVKEIPERITGRPRTKRDPFEFEGPFSVEWKKVRGPKK